MLSKELRKKSFHFYKLNCHCVQIIAMWNQQSHLHIYIFNLKFNFFLTQDKTESCQDISKAYSPQQYFVIHLLRKSQLRCSIWFSVSFGFFPIFPSGLTEVQFNQVWSQRSHSKIESGPAIKSKIPPYEQCAPNQ